LKTSARLSEASAILGSARLSSENPALIFLAEEVQGWLEAIKTPSLFAFFPRLMLEVPAASRRSTNVITHPKIEDFL